MSSSLLKGFCLLSTSVLINLLIATFIFLPSHNNVVGELKEMPQLRKLTVDKVQETQVDQTVANALHEAQLQLAAVRDELEKSRSELDKSRSELDKARNKFVQAAQDVLVPKPQPPAAPCIEKECSCRTAVNTVIDLRRALEVQYEFRDSLLSPLSESTSVLKRKVVKIPRVDGRKLSFQEFFEKYELTQTPVIITDYSDHMFSVNWTLLYLQKLCGDTKAKLQHFDPKHASWGNLVGDKKSSKVSEFIDQVTLGTAGNTYLFDWSIPHNCPALLESYSVPKYFASDYFQRVPKDYWEGSGGGYSNTWPSLFIGTGDTRSGLHVDAAQTHFWMAMIQGRKRWAVVIPDEVPFLYPDPEGTTFQIGDIFDFDLSKYPLASKATIWEEILAPGDIIFVPGGAAHQIRNLETIISVSMNFVDEENVKRHTASIINKHPKVAEFMMDKRNRGMSSKQDDLEWEEFKTFPRESEEKYDLFNF